MNPFYRPRQMTARRPSRTLKRAPPGCIRANAARRTQVTKRGAL